MKSRVFQGFLRKENFKEFAENAEKQAETMEMVGSMENCKCLNIKELRK